MKAVFVFCEGPHDVAFIARSLLTHGHGLPYTGTIAELPTPLGRPQSPGGRQTESLVANYYADRAFDHSTITQARHAPAPAFESIIVDTGRERLYALLSAGGAPTENPQCMTLIERVHLALNSSVRSTIRETAVAFVSDADADRRAAEQAVRCYCKPHFGPRPALAHDEWVDTDEGRLGCYIWHAPATDMGTLETVVEPLLRAALGATWQAAEQFVDSQTSPACADPAKRCKAITGSTVQLHKPGSSASYAYNRQVTDSSYFKTAPVCKAIVAFLTRAFGP